ncbi:MAG: S26 family signal peptidase [Pseudomonadota bacterium]
MIQSGLQRRHRRRLQVIGSAFVALLALAAFAPTVKAPLLIWNRTPSEPIGLYRRSFSPAAPGRLVAFIAPPAAFPYAERRLGHLHRVPILKEVAAAAGDVVCTDDGALHINGQWRAPIQTRDSEGAPLPRWTGCRALTSREIFVYSQRIPNSFDSRYFGPIDLAMVKGVFAPLITAPNRGKAA